MNRKQWFVSAFIFLVDYIYFLTKYLEYLRLCVYPSEVFCNKANIFIAFVFLFGAFATICFICGLLEPKEIKHRRG